VYVLDINQSKYFVKFQPLSWTELKAGLCMFWTSIKANTSLNFSFIPGQNLRQDYIELRLLSNLIVNIDTQLIRRRDKAETGSGTRLKSLRNVKIWRK
jgi:hypothetical protein